MADHHLQAGHDSARASPGFIARVTISPSSTQADTPSLLSLGLSVEEVEKTMLQEALQKSGGNVSEASRLLKITRNTLRYRMAKHNLSQPQG